MRLRDLESRRINLWILYFSDRIYKNRSVEKLKQKFKMMRFMQAIIAVKYDLLNND